MKKRSLRYAGDKAVRALLERYACPTSFHVVRTRLLGNIATPKLDASPLRAIESCWEGELPEFDNVGAANELFESLMGLWNVYVLCLLFIHPRAPNLINLRSASTMPT